MSDGDPFFVMDGEEYCDESEVLARLLREEVLFCNTAAYNCNGCKGETVVLFIVANDVWAWGCADARDLTTIEIGPLYKAWDADRKWGVIKWLCKREKLAPQVPIVRDMKAAGVWDAEMDALPLPEPS